MSLNQKVKLQFNCELEDVPRFASVTLGEAIDNLSSIANLLNDVKFNLSRKDPTDLEGLKSALEQFERIRIHLVKIDNRIADVTSVIGGLVEFQENPSKANEESSVSGDVDDKFNSR